MTSRTGFTPARWPAARGNNRFLAHRPLPSMITAMCRGSLPGTSIWAMRRSSVPGAAQSRKSCISPRRTTLRSSYNARRVASNCGPPTRELLEPAEKMGRSRAAEAYARCARCCCSETCRRRGTRGRASRTVRPRRFLASSGARRILRIAVRKVLRGNRCMPCQVGTVTGLRVLTRFRWTW